MGSAEKDHITGVRGVYMSRQNDNKKTFQIRVSKEWWVVLSHFRTISHMSFKQLVEEALKESYMSPDEYKRKRLGTPRNENS